MSLPRVILKPRKAQPFFARHPWVFAGAIDRIEGTVQDGDSVDLISTTGNFVARGLYNSQSKIRVRLLSWNPDQPLDRSFFAQRLQKAIRLRDQLGLRGPNRGCRLVFSEGDYLSGCTIDEYDRWLVLQFTSLGMAKQHEIFVDILNELIQPKGIYLRSDKGIGLMEGLEVEDGVLSGEPPPHELILQENGLEFVVHLEQGQKTGYYLDQRDNHLLVGRLSRGRRVLDAFCYCGGFALHAAQAGAVSVLGIDVSEPALQLARENTRRNCVQNVTFQKGDVFAVLDQIVKEQRKFDLVVLDPPKFARNRGNIQEAINGYRRLQSLAVRLLDSDGILTMCCCSGSITMEMLTELTAQIAVDEKRDIQILSKTGASADHPVAATCLESNYLKCLISRVA